MGKESEELDAKVVLNNGQEIHFVLKVDINTYPETYNGRTFEGFDISDVKIDFLTNDEAQDIFNIGIKESFISNLKDEDCSIDYLFGDMASFIEDVKKYLEEDESPLIESIGEQIELETIEKKGVNNKQTVEEK